ncbi:ABC transporter permease [Lampropedia cohaerens]|uniref:ABC transporter permease n=1 Tax=Lampropedia cohaerens TaxID=1610491 RepID=A0A0U1PZJ7_9BURK|nr:ABC transporter permease [Lampropedia cohaerens]
MLQYACQRYAPAGDGPEPHGLRLLMATGLGLLMLYAAEFACVALGIPAILLPAPSQVVQALWAQRQLLAADAMQTIVRAMLPGWLLGSALAIVTAVLCDRFSFLRRGLLPLGHFIAALPIVGLAPIFVMWFGFDWPSKAAIALVVTFFPVLINTAAGLQQAGAMERDLMHAYAASPMQTLRWLTLPAALPFIFNGLRITVPLALIGAIVAEFFGTPIVGMGFRMSVSLGQMAMPMVWAEIVVAAVIAMALVALLVALERRLTFWHPSLRT